MCSTAAEAANTLKVMRATPKMPRATMAPENRTETGLGATAWASGSQKW